MKKGDKVVCVKGGGWTYSGHGPKPQDNYGPKKGEVLIVSEVFRYGETLGLMFDEYEFDSSGHPQCYNSVYFRKVDGDHKKTFISTSASRELANKPIIREIVEIPKKKEYEHIKN